MKEIQLKISAKIKTAREDAKISQQELGKLLRLSRSAYIKIEQGQTAITVTRLLEIGALVGKPLAYFLQDLEDIPAPLIAMQRQISEQKDQIAQQAKAIKKLETNLSGFMAMIERLSAKISPLYNESKSD